MLKNKVDKDFIIKCAKQAGAAVTKSENGRGGIYLKGKELTMDEIKGILMNGPDDVKEIN